MKRLLVISMIALFAGVVASPADARPLPKVGYNLAKQQTHRTLRQSAMWRYRDVGYVLCRGGRIDRSNWSCRVYIVKGRKCLAGRSRTWTSFLPSGEGYVETRISFGKRYRCRGV